MTRSVPRAAGVTVLAAVVTMLACVVGWPLVALVGSAAGAGWPVASTLGVSLAFSMLVAAAVATVTVALAAGLASVVMRGRIVGRGFVVLALLLPLVTPPAIAALAVRFALEAAGALPLTATGGALAVAIAQVVALLPHAFVVLVNALGGIDRDVEDAAVSLGATPLTAFRRTTLALLSGGIGCAALVVWTLALSDLASPLLVGGPAPFLAGAAFAAARDGRIDVASAAAVALTAPALAAWILALRLGWPRLGPVSAERLAERSPAAAPSGVGSMVAIVLAAVTAASVLVMPLVWLWNGSAVPLDDIAAIVAASLVVAIAVAIAGTTVAFAIAIVAARSGRGGFRGAAWLALSTAGVPGVALALGALVAFAIAPAEAGLWTLVALFAVWKLPTAVVLATRRLDALDPALEEAAVSLGAGEGTIAWRIVIPLLAPTASAAFLDLVVQTLTSTGLLLVFGAGAGAVVWHSLNGDIGGASAVATALGAVALAVMLLRLWLAPREPIALLPA